MKTKKISFSMILWIVLALVVLGSITKAGLILLRTKGVGAIHELPVRLDQSDIAESLPTIRQVRDFTLTSQESKPFGLTDLKGKVWIANFIFTRCAGPCPLMSARMRALGEKFLKSDKVHFVSFSVDPEYDQPEVLEKYAKKYFANSKRWSFLTGKKEDVFKIAVSDFLLGTGDVPEDEREAMDQGVFHSTKFVLVDQAGNIRGYYDSESASAREKLASDMQLLINMS